MGKGLAPKGRNRLAPGNAPRVRRGEKTSAALIGKLSRKCLILNTSRIEREEAIAELFGVCVQSVKAIFAVLSFDLCVDRVVAFQALAHPFVDGPQDHVRHCR